MTYESDPEAGDVDLSLLDAGWIGPGGLTCDQCRRQLSGFIRSRLAGQEPEDEPASGQIREHLEACAICGWAYADLLELIPAGQIRMLFDSWLDTNRRPTSLALGGLLELHQVLLNTAEAVDDRSLAAWSLSVMGMVRRCQNDPAEATAVHRLALRTASADGDLLARVVSNADLGSIALARGDFAESLGYFREAQRRAAEAGDSDNEDRAHQLIVRTVTEQAMAEVERVKASLEGLTRRLAAAARGGARSFALRSFAAAGEAGVLVVNWSRELPLTVCAGPDLDATGSVGLSVRFDARSLPTDRPVYLDLLALAHDGPLATVTLGDAERAMLRTLDGTRIGSTLPGFTDQALEELRARLASESREHLEYPRRWVSLRIWWDE